MQLTIIFCSSQLQSNQMDPRLKKYPFQSPHRKYFHRVAQVQDTNTVSQGTEEIRVSTVVRVTVHTHP